MVSPENRSPAPGADPAERQTAEGALPGGPKIQLTGQQLALYESLARKEASLGRMYLGGLLVLADEGNPDSLALAAHGVRELLEKLPTYIEVPMQAHQERLTPKVNELQMSWGKGQKSRCKVGEGWKGEIDRPLQAFLGRVGRFFAWVDESMPRRRAEVAGALRKMDPSGRVIPAPLEDLNIEKWNRIRSFFVSVAHHTHSCGREDFAQWLDELERFLLERLRPRTFAEFDRIDALIRAGEGRG